MSSKRRKFKSGGSFQGNRDWDNIGNRINTSHSGNGGKGYYFCDICGSNVPPVGSGVPFCPRCMIPMQLMTETNPNQRKGPQSKQAYDYSARIFYQTEGHPQYVGLPIDHPDPDDEDAVRHYVARKEAARAQKRGGGMPQNQPRHNRFAKRPPQGRPDNRQDFRGDNRYENRQDNRFDPQTDGRSDGRLDGRLDNRPDNRPQGGYRSGHPDRPQGQRPQNYHHQNSGRPNDQRSFHRRPPSSSSQPSAAPTQATPQPAQAELPLNQPTPQPEKPIAYDPPKMERTMDHPVERPIEVRTEPVRVEPTPLLDVPKTDESTLKRPKRRVISQSQADGLSEPAEAPKTRKPRVKTPAESAAVSETPVEKSKVKRVVRKKVERVPEGSSAGTAPLL